jgi:UDP-2-acetamido-3-amino-2,3-dideoxy-glucuronate N-acetyltransferase
MGDYFKHSLALVETDDIGDGTRIWAFAHIMAGARIGKNCNIGDHCFIEGGVRIGDDVTVKNHVAIWKGVTVENGAFIGPGVTLTNDLRPRSRDPDWVISETRIGQGVTLGANVTLLCGITVGSFAFVGASALVTKDVPPHALVYGSPARIKGYICRCATSLDFRDPMASCPKCGRVYLKGEGGVSLQRKGVGESAS